GANIRRGAQAEIQQANERFTSRGGAGDGTAADAGGAALVADVSSQCGTIVYEADCLSAVERAAAGAATLEAGARAEVVAALRQVATRNPGIAARVAEIANRAGLPMTR